MQKTTPSLYILCGISGQIPHGSIICLIYLYCNIQVASLEICSQVIWVKLQQVFGSKLTFGMLPHDAEGTHEKGVVNISTWAAKNTECNSQSNAAKDIDRSTMKTWLCPNSLCPQAPAGTLHFHRSSACISRCPKRSEQPGQADFLLPMGHSQIAAWELSTRQDTPWVTSAHTSYHWPSSSPLFTGLNW